MRHKILSFGFGLLMAFASMPAMAQDQVVKGQVVDENGEGMTIRRIHNARSSQFSMKSVI